MNRIARILIFLCVFPQLTLAQTTKVKGRVTDQKTGEPVPFAAVFFAGSTIGMTTDMDGFFAVETRDTTLSLVSVRLLGYDGQDRRVKPGCFNECNFSLVMTDNRLIGAVVRPDNRYMKWILSQVELHREHNNPETRSDYQCDLYNKMEIDMENPEDNVSFLPMKKKFGFVFDYVDTSLISGQPYLPALISETCAEKHHRRSPLSDRETIEASRISGFNSGNALSQLTGSLQLRMNFYNPFINAFEVEIPSPASKNGDLYYNYFLIDSSLVEGRKTYTVRFHPKSHVSTPCFDGEMGIDAEEFALKDVHAKLRKGQNVNWIRDLVIDVENQRVGDSVWFYLHDDLYVDFSVSLRDSSSLMSFIGRRHLQFRNPSFCQETWTDKSEKSFSTVVLDDAGLKDDSWWDSARPYALTKRERDIYAMVDSVQNARTYRNVYTLINMFATGYVEIGRLGYGTYSDIFGWNDIEGFRTRLGVRTTREFSRKVRLMGYGAYGTRDRQVKGGGSFEYVFSTQPTRKLTIEAGRDLMQLGKGLESSVESDIFNSLLAKDNDQRMSLVRQFSIGYEHEFNQNVTEILSFKVQDIFSNPSVPMALPDGTNVRCVSSNQIRSITRLSWKETVTRGVFDNQHLYSRYPVILIDLNGSIKGLGSNPCSFFRPELTVNYRCPTPPLGVAKIRFNCGHIFGTVPYPMLKIHEGNQTYSLDQTAFSCMNYYEFASDSWASFFYEQNFGGFILGKIPLVRNLNLREVFTVKAVCGTLSSKNDGTAGSEVNPLCPMIFPEGLSSLGKPYVEVGCGVTNIFRVLRLDAFWRVTHRCRETDGVRVKSPDCFALNVGVEFDF